MGPDGPVPGRVPEQRPRPAGSGLQIEASSRAVRPRQRPSVSGCGFGEAPIQHARQGRPGSPVTAAKASRCDLSVGHDGSLVSPGTRDPEVSPHARLVPVGPQPYASARTKCGIRNLPRCLRCAGGNRTSAQRRPLLVRFARAPPTGIDRPEVMGGLRSGRRRRRHHRGDRPAATGRAAAASERQGDGRGDATVLPRGRCDPAGRRIHDQGHGRGRLDMRGRPLPVRTALRAVDQSRHGSNAVTPDADNA